ncbi:hypothetical protein GCM10009549_49420 [Streptomyces thermoalcalitolerans]|uniref:Uncharacterized protein n=1 Tax=Streptomyces thermoalcalitolerans TaxID=65605 RepID=A0ABN1PG81_9ACTN
MFLSVDVVPESSMGHTVSVRHHGHQCIRSNTSATRQDPATSRCRRRAGLGGAWTVEWVAAWVAVPFEAGREEPIAWGGYGFAVVRYLLWSTGPTTLGRTCPAADGKKGVP